MGYNCQVSGCDIEGECHERNGHKFTLCNKHWIQFQHLEQAHLKENSVPKRKAKRRDRAKADKRAETRYRQHCRLQALRPVVLDEIPNQEILREYLSEEGLPGVLDSGAEGREGTQGSAGEEKPEVEEEIG